MSKEQDHKETLKKWIIENSKVEGADKITFSTPILEQKILSSLKVMEMIVFLESVKGSPVDVEQLKPGAFSSIDTIYDRFIKES